MAREQYEVKHITPETTYTLEGEATTPQNACRKAFRTLIKAGKIKRQPKHDRNSPSTFANTEVRVCKET